MDGQRQKKETDIVKKVFRILFLVVLLYLIFGELLLPEERVSTKYDCTEYNEGWVWVKPDGSKEPVDIPGSCDVERNETVVIENTLPLDLKDNTYFAIRSSKQEMKILVDGELCFEYTTKHTRLFGKTSPVAYIFFELKPKYSGQTITIETKTDTSYTGIFYSIYYGDKLGIWGGFFEQYGAELITALFMLVFSVVVIVGSMVARLYFHKPIQLEYLGWGVLLVSIWIIANSVFRQLMFSNLSVIGDITFFMIMLLSTPFMIYLDGIQKGRFHRVYQIVEWIAIGDFVVCTILHVTNRIDFADTITYIAVVCVIAIFTMIITMFIDIYKKRVKEYYLVAVGVLGISVAASIQIYIYFCRTVPFSGRILAMGLIFLLGCSIINEIQNVQVIEKEKQQAISSNVSKGRFLANMSHEIRTPINVILGMDAMILRESTNKQIKEYALDIQNSGQILMSLINDILDFSKMESGKMEIIPVEYDFSSVIHDVSNMTLAKIGEKPIELQVLVDNNLPVELYGDEVRIRQILVNLMTNAVKYTDEGSVTLSVTGERKGDNIILHFSVEDTGIGIKEEDLEKLFEEFERIEERRNHNIEGTGLGMSITTQLLKMMGSKLEVKSVYGKGSIFSFDLEQPIIDEEAIGNLEERIRQQTLDYNYDVTFTAPQAQILLVDDNEINRKVFVNLLKETKVQIDEAECGQDCLNMVQKKHYDLIFLDHMMPEMDGVETLHHMKEKKDYPCKDTPVIALTANAMSGAKEMYLSEGFDAFLSKPVVPDKLEKMIQDMLPGGKITDDRNNTDNVTDSQQAVTLQSSEERELPFVDGIDWGFARQHFPDMQMLLDTVSDFDRMLDTEADYLELCYNAIHSNPEQLEEYRIKVHAMKSSATMIGAIPLSGMAKVLEYAARDKNTDTIERMTPVFLQEWREYKEKLKVVLSDSKGNNKKRVNDKAVILKFLEILGCSMEELDLDVADEAMNQLKQYEYEEPVQSHMHQLSVAVTNLDAEQALQLIEQIESLLKA